MIAILTSAGFVLPCNEEGILISDSFMAISFNYVH